MILDINPQYIKNQEGKDMVMLPQDEFEKIIEELEELEDIRLFDEAIKEDDGGRISLDNYLQNRNFKNG